MYNHCDVSRVWRPAVRACVAFRKNALLVVFRQLNVAMAVAMDVHEHFASDKKSVFMNPRILPLRHIGQAENALP